MKLIILLIFFLIISNINTQSQYPFEKYPALQYNRKSNWEVIDKFEKEGYKQRSITITDFYSDGDSLTILVTTYRENDTSQIRIFKNGLEIQRINEPFPLYKNLGMKIDTFYYNDINGDNLLDIKMLGWYAGCGSDVMNERVIYLFQKKNSQFTKVSFTDKIPSTRIERDFNNDGNYEIITMKLDNLDNQSYWTFNLYNYKNNSLKCVNSKYDYPIMIENLSRKNFEITDRIGRSEMKNFEQKLPDSLDIKK